MARYLKYDGTLEDADRVIDEERERDPEYSGNLIAVPETIFNRKDKHEEDQ